MRNLPVAGKAITLLFTAAFLVACSGSDTKDEEEAAAAAAAAAQAAEQAAAAEAAAQQQRLDDAAAQRHGCGMVNAQSQTNQKGKIRG